MRRLSATLGIEDRLIVITNFPHVIKPLLYSACDVFVSPTDNIQETFGLSVTEAMSCGLPVVASDWSGYKDTVANGVTGLLARTLWNQDAAREISKVAPICDYSVSRHHIAQRTVIDNVDLYRHLHTLLTNEELRRTMGIAGRRRIEEKFAWPIVLKQWEQLWQEQWNTLRNSMRHQCRPASTLDYTGIFGHFATGSLDRSSTVQLSKYGAEVASTLRNGSRSLLQQMGLPVDCDPDLFIQLLDLRSGDERSIESLLPGRNADALNTIAWALKKGYLELPSRD